jgi:hypothetical protein
MTLLSAEVRIFRAANEALSKRYRTKKNRICQGGALTVEMRKTYYLRRRQKSRLDVTSALRGLFKSRGSRLGDDVVLAGSLVIMRALVKRL